MSKQNKCDLSAIVERKDCIVFIDIFTIEIYNHAAISTSYEM